MGPRKAWLYRGVLLLFLFGGGAGDAEALLYPSVQGIRVNPQDPNTVYLVQSGTIILFNADGTLKPYPTAGAAPGTTIIDVAGLPPDGTNPQAAVLTHAGADYTLQALRFEPGGGVFLPGTTVAGSAAPSCLGVSPDQSAYFVGDSGAQDIKIYDRSGTTFTPNGTLADTQNTVGIAVDSAGNVYATTNTASLNTIPLAAPTPQAILTPGAGDTFQDVAVDSSGNVYVTTTNGTASAVKKHRPDGSPVAYLPGGDGATTSWRTPGATPRIASDGSFVYVAQGNEQRKYSGWTGANALFGATTLSPGPKTYAPYPGTVATDPNAPTTVFAASQINYGGANKTVLEKYGGNGLLDGAFAPPTPLTGGSETKALVSDGAHVVVSNGSTIQTYNTATGALLGSQNLGIAVKGLATDGSGALYVLFENGNVTQYAYSGGTWGSSTAKGNVGDPDTMAGIAVDSSGNIYVSNAKGGVCKSTGDGMWPGKTVANQGTGFRGVAVDSSGRIHTLDTAGIVTVFTPAGAPAKTVDVSGTSWGTGFALDPATGYLPFAGTGQNGLYCLDPNGTPQNFSFQPGTPTPVPSPSATPSPSPEPSGSPTSSPSPEPSGSPTPTVTLMPQPSTPPPTLGVTISGGVPRVSPSPLPSDAPPIPTGPPHPLLKIVREILLELFSCEFADVQILAVQEGQYTSFIVGGAAGSILIRLNAVSTEENGLVYSWALLLRDQEHLDDPEERWTMVGHGTRPGETGIAARGAGSTTLSVSVLDNGSFDWNPQVGVVDIQSAQILVGARVITGTPTATGTPWSGGGSSGCTSLGLSPALLLLLVPLALLRR